MVGWLGALSWIRGVLQCTGGCRCILCVMLVRMSVVFFMFFCEVVGLDWDGVGGWMEESVSRRYWIRFLPFKKKNSLGVLEAIV